MTQRLFSFNTNQLAETPFLTRGLIALNPTGAPVYVRIGGQDFPNAATANFIIPPATYMTIPIPETTIFGFAFGTAVLASQLGTKATFILTDEVTQSSIASVQLPQVLYNVLTVPMPFSLPAPGVVTTYTPPTGKSTAIHQIWGTIASGVLVGTIMAVQIENVQTGLVLATWQARGVAGGSVAVVIPPLTFAPQPIILGVNEQIRVRNFAGGESAAGNIIMSTSNF